MGGFLEYREHQLTTVVGFYPTDRAEVQRSVSGLECSDLEILRRADVKVCARVIRCPLPVPYLG